MADNISLPSSFPSPGGETEEAINLESTPDADTAGTEDIDADNPETDPDSNTPGPGSCGRADADEYRGDEYGEAVCGQNLCRQRRIALQRILATHVKGRERLQQENDVLRARVENLNDKVAGLQNRLKRGAHTKRTWQAGLRDHLEKGLGSYDAIYRKSCKEENMSSRTFFTHPNLLLTAPRTIARLRVAEYSERAFRFPGEFHRFNDLPITALQNIFRLWMYKEGQLVHCLSRLDPYQAPADLPSSQSKLPNRFYWRSRRKMNVTEDTEDPQDALRLLLVCRRFYFMGVHAFYGLNTFAFSSLGEFQRFCNGSGRGRVARIQHLELTWMGNQCLTAPPVREPIGPSSLGGGGDAELDGRVRVTHYSLRTLPLYHLHHMPRLSSMVVFINESAHGHTRRRYEPREKKAFMAAITRRQPNRRLTRSLRTVQGLDHVNALRGMKWIHFYDLWQALRTGGRRVIVQDTTFVADVNSTVSMPRVGPRAIAARLRNLEPLFRGHGEGEGADNDSASPNQRWTPSEMDWKVVKGFDEKPPDESVYDETRRFYGVEDEDSSSEDDDKTGSVNDSHTEEGDGGSGSDGGPRSDGGSGTDDSSGGDSGSGSDDGDDEVEGSAAGDDDEGGTDDDGGNDSDSSKSSSTCGEDSEESDQDGGSDDNSDDVPKKVSSNSGSRSKSESGLFVTDDEDEGEGEGGAGAGDSGSDEDSEVDQDSDANSGEDDGDGGDGSDDDNDGDNEQSSARDTLDSRPEVIVIDDDDDDTVVPRDPAFGPFYPLIKSESEPDQDMFAYEVGSPDKDSEYSPYASDQEDNNDAESDREGGGEGEGTNKNNRNKGGENIKAARRDGPDPKNGAGSDDTSYEADIDLPPRVPKAPSKSAAAPRPPKSRSGASSNSKVSRPPKRPNSGGGYPTPKRRNMG